jgi:hypothetical protein
MPTVLRSGPYRFYFYSRELNERPHVHVEREKFTAKFWLEPLTVARNSGFTERELHRVQSIIENHKYQLLETWHGYFGSRSR